MKLFGFDWNVWELLGSILFVVGVFTAAAGMIIIILKGTR